MRAIFFDSAGGLDLTPDINLIAESVSSGENLIWFDFEDFTDKDLKFLQKLFGFHNLAIEDCQSTLHLAKIDFYPDQSFVIWNYPTGEISNHFEIRSIQFFLGKNYLVSLHKDNMPQLDMIYQEYSSDPKLIQKGTQWLFHVIIDGIVDQCFPFIDQISTRLDRVEEQIFENPEPRELKKVFKIKHQLFSFRKIILPEREVINELVQRENIHVDENIRFYFQDIYDHLLRLLDFIETERELISGIIDIHLSSTSNRLNEVMQKLTIVATIFMPITFLTGLYGMNFRYMPLLNLPAGFWVMAGLMVTITGYMLYIMRKRGWW